jgi:hypothetical protein
VHLVQPGLFSLASVVSQCWQREASAAEEGGKRLGQQSGFHAGLLVFSIHGSNVT